LITYDDLAGGLEDAWVAAGLHEHAVIESMTPDTLERTYRVEIFPAHPEPLTESIAPPWVELAFTWNPAHYLAAERRDFQPGALELAWTYTVDVRHHTDRPDPELVRAFNNAVRAALKRTAPDIPMPADYIAIEVRRGYRTMVDRPTQAYIQLIGTNMTDLSDLWDDRNSETLREVLREELRIVAALLHALAETFAPNGVGGYRTVDTA
jgi:fermentation-respiration switch protein FrsA (DUF1100 family)